MKTRKRIEAGLAELAQLDAGMQHTSSIRRLTWLDDRTCCSGGGDATAILWDDGSPIAALEHKGQSERVRAALQRVRERAERAIVAGIEEVLGRSLPDLELVAHVHRVRLERWLRKLHEPVRAPESVPRDRAGVGSHPRPI